MEDRNADTLREALRNVPSLTFNAGEGGRTGDNITLRGYSAVGDLYLDGMRDMAQYHREVFNLEQIDVLRGSASMLFGRGSTGGVINQVSKQPFLSNQGEVAATLGSYRYRRLTTDVNQVLGENMAIRLNAMGTDAGSPRNGVEQGRWGIAPSISWGSGTRNEFNLSYYQLKDDNVPDLGVPYFANRPLAVPIDRFYGMANADYDKNDTRFLTARYTHRFDSDTSIRTVLRRADYSRDLWAVAPRLNRGTTIIDEGTPLNRQRQARGSTEEVLTSQTDFVTKLRAGGMTQNLLIGAELVREEMSRWSNTNSVANPATTVGNPNPFPLLPADYFSSRHRVFQASYKSNTTGLYAQDFIEFTPQWKWLVGARWDRMSADYDRVAPAGPLSRTDSVWSWRTGLIWQPGDTVSWYASTGSSFNPSAELYALDDRSVNTGPETSRNYELGAKWDLADADLSLRAALFRSQKRNERNTDLSTPDLYLLSGKRHTDGLEIEVAGRITPRWEVFGSVALMKARIDTASGQQADTQGNRPLNTPPYTANLWTTYRFDGGWRLGGGAQGTGARYASNADTNLAPRYLRWDAMLAYEQKDYTVRLNVLNLFDKDYYEGVYAGHVVPGTPRIVQVTAEYKF
jgi:catecholate siderophore receptor